MRLRTLARVLLTKNNTPLVCIPAWDCDLYFRPNSLHEPIPDEILSAASLADGGEYRCHVVANLSAVRHKFLELNNWEWEIE